MSERYTRLFALPENLYAASSPVVIAAGTLLKDNQTGNVVAQLKLRSISPKRIAAVKVSLQLRSTAGDPIGEPVDFDYLDLSAGRDAEFGQKTPVPVPETKARAYAPAVTEVVFADKTTWTARGEAWEPLPGQKTLEAVLGDWEYTKQYQITLGGDVTHYPLADKDLWYCACGALNHDGEACHVCGRTLAQLQTIDLAQVKADRDARLAREAAAAEAKAAEEKAAAEAAKRKFLKVLKIAVPAVCAVIALALLVAKVIIPNSKYNAAAAQMEAGQYEDAIAAFEAMEGYRDSNEQIANCEKAILDAEFAHGQELLASGDYDAAIAIFESLGDYPGSADGIAAAEEGKLEGGYQAAEALAENGETAKAAKAFGKLGDYRDAWKRSFDLWGEITPRETLSTLAEHTVGLKTDGTVVAVGHNEYGQCNVSGWTDIVAISAGVWHTVGLKADGTVVATGNNKDGQCNVSKWADIPAISAGWDHTVGLKTDGTVVAVGSNKYGQRNVSGWTDIVSISAGGYHTVVLKADGTVVAVGPNKYDQCNVSEWENIVAVSAGSLHTVGLKADGTVVAVGSNGFGQCNVSGWTDIKLPN